MRDGVVLLLCGSGLVLAAIIIAPRHFRLLLLRSRWLLLTMLMMFGWLTPGTPLPMIPGASLEGLLLAADNLARLLIALAAVAMILTALPPAELVAGMRTLLAPLALLRIRRDQVAVRLALTLNEVEASRNGGRSQAAPLANTLLLPASTFGMLDLALFGLASVLILGAWLT